MLNMSWDGAMFVWGSIVGDTHFWSWNIQTMLHTCRSSNIFGNINCLDSLPSSFAAKLLNQGARDIKDPWCGMMRVRQSQANRFNDGASDLNRENTSMGWQHIHAKHDPHCGGQGGCTYHSTPYQAQLSDVVNGEPIGKGLDQVHHANQKGHSCIGFSTPIVFPTVWHFITVVVYKLFRPFPGSRMFWKKNRPFQDLQDLQGNQSNKSWFILWSAKVLCLANQLKMLIRLWRSFIAWKTWQTANLPIGWKQPKCCTSC